MARYFIMVLPTATLIVAVAETTDRSTPIGALPAIARLCADTGDVERATDPACANFRLVQAQRPSRSRAAFGPEVCSETSRNATRPSLTSTAPKIRSSSDL